MQDTLGVEGVLPIDAEWVADQARCLLEDMPVDAFKIGVLGSVENIAAIAEIVSDYPDVPLILDPVLASGRGDELASDEMAHALRELCCRRPRSSRPTASRRGGSPTSRRRRGRASRSPSCAQRLIETGCEYVLITGTHEPTPQVVNTLYGKDGVVRTDTLAAPARQLPRLRAARSPRRSRRCSRNGLDLAEAVREAQDYTWHTLQKAYRPGMGQFLPDRLFWAREDDAEPRDERAPRAVEDCTPPMRAAATDAAAMCGARARARRAASTR